MNHYRVLGVEPDAETADIRRAYLRLARVNHPDFSGASGEQMRLINAAWHVLGDAERRLSYDRTLRSAARNGSSSDISPGTGFTYTAAADGQPSRIARPSDEFTPFSQNDEDDDDAWRFEPDAGDPATVPPKVLLAAPAFAFIAGIGMLAVSAPTGIRAFTALGLISLILSALLFVGAPVVALFKSQMVEQQASHRRSSHSSAGDPD